MRERCGSASFFEGADFRHAAGVPFLPREPRAEKRRHHVGGEVEADDPRPEGDDVGVVVLHGLVCRVGVVGLGAANPDDLVGGDRGPGTRSTHDDAPVGLPGNHGLAHRRGVVRVVDGIFVVRAEIGDRVSRSRHHPGEVFLHPVPGVVGGDGDAHGGRVVSNGGAVPCRSPARPYNRPVHQLVVTGGRPLRGEVAVLGAKNAVLKHLVATLMAPGRHRLDNVPEIDDVALMVSVIEHIGATCRFSGTSVEVDVPDELLPVTPIDLVRRMRASILVLGALLARCGEARVALPGGDDFGSRPIDMHLDGLKAMGAEFELVHGELRARAPEGLHGAEVPLDFPSVGATENVLFAGAMARGTTVISNAAREPEIQDLAEFLRKMGAVIHGAGTSTIEVEGVPRLAPASHRAVPDRLEAGTYLVAGAITGGDVTVRDCVPEHLRMELRKLGEAGCEIDVGKDWIRILGPDRPRAVDFATLPYPGFHTDMHPQMVALLAVAAGTSVITENIYSARFRYVGELNRLGADVSLEGQHVIIRGVDRLSGCPVDACDIRAGAALVLAGLTAEGFTTVTDAQHIDRGYSSFDQHLRDLGADIVREPGGFAATPA